MKAKGSADLQNRASMRNPFCDLVQVCQESLNQEITKLKAGAIRNQMGAQKMDEFCTDQFNKK